MRKIKFRAWIKGEMISADDLAFEEYAPLSDLLNNKEINLMQYTGLKDRNGKEIYEGDIIKTRQYGVDDGKGHNFSGFDRFSIEFEDGSFCLKNEWRRFNLRPNDGAEVIGNIYENPELIKNGENY